MPKLQRVLDELVTAGAAGVLVHYRDGRGEWRGSSGVADLRTRGPVDPDGWFRIGSVTKTFTAAVVLQLVGEGVLTLEDRVGRWLPGVVPGGEGITLRQLLNHTSGLYNYTDDLTDRTAIVRDRFVHWEPMRAVGMAVSHEPLFEPGARSSYSNTNYILLGMVIEVATGASYGAEVKRRILDPLGMRRTVVPGDEVRLPEPHAHGYEPVGDELVDTAEYNVSQAWAAGEIVSTAADLNRFYAGLLTGEVLRPAELEAMLTTVDNGGPDSGYGLGIERRVLADGEVVWGHTGGIYGYRTLSFHSADGGRQFSLSYTGTDAPSQDEVVAAAFASGLD